MTFVWIKSQLKSMIWLIFNSLLQNKTKIYTGSYTQLYLYSFSPENNSLQSQNLAVRWQNSYLKP